MKIRPATEQDCPVLAEIDIHSNPHPWSSNQFSAALHHPFQHIIVIEKNNKICGFAVWQTIAEETELHLIAISPQYRRQRLGSQLIQHWLQYVQTQGITNCFLEVRESNQPAIALYQQHGFIERYRRPNYYPLPSGDSEAALIMEKTC